MNFSNILNEIEKSDPEVYEKLSGRRNVLKSFGAKVAVAAMPVALASLFQKAYGKTAATSAVVDALNFALKLEYMEYNYFHVANNTGNLIPATDLPGFQTIEAQELEHINFLTATVNNLAGAGAAYTPPNYKATALNPAYIPFGTYDFTAGGIYQVFNDYPSFLTIAQVFEDTVIHSYQGSVPTFFGNTFLTQLMQLQCAEGRHAAHVRLVRRFLPGAEAADYPAPWITNNIAPPALGGTSFQSYYLGEDNVTQNGIVITSLPDISGTIPEASATAAFDEPFSQTTITSLIAPFFIV